MKNITAEKIALVCNGELHTGKDYDEKREASCVVIDSRLIEKDGVFVATKGARVNGHDYIPEVMKKGALCAVCEETPESDEYTYVLVEDSFAALKAIAKYYRSCLDVKIVGIIGSVGKTSTKELVASVLSGKFNTLKTEGNFNNEVGVPLTICRIRDEHEAAVVEMGISDFGEMARLGDIVRPDAVVMTNIGPCHLEKLIDLDGVLRAKTVVFDYMKDDSVLILNNQDAKLSSVRKSGNKKIIYYGKGSSIYADNTVSHGLAGTEFVLNLYGYSGKARVNLPGEHMVINSLAAAAIAYEWGLSPEQIIAGIGRAEGLKGRCNIIENKDYVVVDDCYNANPKSMKASIDMMSYAKGRKVAILGDMFELGEEEKELHSQIGRYAVNKGIDLLLCVGKLSENMYAAAMAEAEKIKEANAKAPRAGDEIRIEYFEDKKDLTDRLTGSRSLLNKGDTILIKASHGMGFDEIVDILA